MLIIQSPERNVISECVAAQDLARKYLFAFSLIVGSQGRRQSRLLLELFVSAVLRKVMSENNAQRNLERKVEEC
jgi:hypothetical protein